MIRRKDEIRKILIFAKKIPEFAKKWKIFENFKTKFLDWSSVKDDEQMSQENKTMETIKIIFLYINNENKINLKLN